MVNFRFEKLEIWQLAIQISDSLFDIADELAEKKKFRLSEQLYGACLSISNNISEGSGSFSDKDFANFLNISRRSVFECANILFIVCRRKYIETAYRDELLKELDHLSRKITNFRKSLL